MGEGSRGSRSAIIPTRLGVKYLSFIRVPKEGYLLVNTTFGVGSGSRTLLGHDSGLPGLLRDERQARDPAARQHTGKEPQRKGREGTRDGKEAGRGFAPYRESLTLAVLRAQVFTISGVAGTGMDG
ncbi:hypothetical protein E2C01_047711 [Portunus trituberculatus]|uniref:Uncharacterized protein n=1 Tax=Portunus trituberculatus TaxID=210409 RepID=A0A5B7G1A2_PORTR|nr:hypothetical protein [Portunus trituberculatus]